jgi:riboflavin biosynthesis pyrimidine reductase
MNDNVLRLYPLPAKEKSLSGLYLSHDLRQYGQAKGSTFVYTNYVTSLDGRIAIPHPTRPGLMVPKAIANPRDWRLFQELAVQADVLITSGRYLRDYADGRAQEILRVYDDPQFADLKEWRLERGLSPQPDWALISGSLKFSIPEGLIRGGRSLLIFTTSQADPERIKALENQAGKVIVAGDTSVDGKLLIDNLAELGYHSVYNTTGPKVLHLLLEAGALDRIYLTYANRILGGKPFASIVDGDLFEPAIDFQLEALYHDPHALEGLGQLLASYDRKQAK